MNEAHSGAVEAHSGAVEAQNGAVEAHSGAAQAQNGAITQGTVDARNKTARLIQELWRSEG